MHSWILTALLFLAPSTAAEGSPASAKFTELMAVMDDVVENRAVGYIRPGEGVEGWKTNRSLGGLRGTPAGGGDSTCDDLLAFSNALLGSRLLSKETTEEILTPRRQHRPPGRSGCRMDALCPREPVPGTRADRAGVGRIDRKGELTGDRFLDRRTGGRFAY